MRTDATFAIMGSNTVCFEILKFKRFKIQAYFPTSLRRDLR
jgi:hypothetical protein